jgi:hypothetical protein
MSKGVLLFAHNNSEIDYAKLAVYAAQRAKKFLQVPVSVVTDNKSIFDNVDADVFDNIIELTDKLTVNHKYFADGSNKNVHSVWNNTSRYSAYSLTPYDDTLVIDVDYIINSTTLNYCWDQPHDFLIYQKGFDLAQWRNVDEFTSIGEHGIPFYWATVFFFRKTSNTELMFALISHIKANWTYYKLVYQVHSSNFRNDIAFSIAIHMLNGFSIGTFAHHLPGKLFYVTDSDFLYQVDDTIMKFLVQKKDSTVDYTPIKTSTVDVHVMNKYSLLRQIDNV